ncbi:phosphoribosylglycinamide formyltransferase [Gallibacterium anatis str. Avicor]|nr:phosphoribosylglycinamide formyltransferase [Gallibacterium anatis str. Avicor]
MKRYSKNSSINDIVKSKLREGWKIKKGKKHNILIAPNSRKLAIPNTPSDIRAGKNFRSQLDFLINKF